MLAWRGQSRLTSTPIRMHLRLSTANGTTGPIPAVWIVPDLAAPTTQELIAADAAVCPTACPHRSRDGKRGTCYTHHGPSLWSPPRAEDPDETSTPARLVARLLPPRPLRITAYGDAAALDAEGLDRLREIAAHHAKDAGPPLGYTAAWRTRPDLQDLCRASTQTDEQSARAELAGWRTYQSPGTNGTPCPHKHPAPDARRLQCIDCKACRAQEGPPRIVAAIHGHGARLWSTRTP